jgi:exodeoxyribonuclease VII small subunit
MSKKNEKQPSLENALTEISQLIEKMENGEQTLEQSLTQFEKGVSLIKYCQKILVDAEQKVQILTQQNNKELLSPYGGTDEDNSND